MGARLFTRDSRMVELTAAGRAMLTPARTAVRSITLAQRAALETTRACLQHLRIGIEDGIEDAVPALLSYEREHPEVVVSLSQMNERHGHEALAAGQIDAFVGVLPPEIDGDVAWTRIEEIPLWAVMRSDHPIAVSSPPVALEAFRRYPIVIVERTERPRLFDQFVGLFSGGGGRQSLRLREFPTFGARSRDAVFAAIGAGRSVGFGTRTELAAYAPPLACSPFEPAIALPAYLSWHRRQSAPAEALAEYLELRPAL